jgi:hypothetical protein
MKKELKNTIITFIIWCFLVYIITAFHIWDFNPGNWDINHRELFIMFGPILGGCLVLSVLLWKDNPNENNLGI